MKVSEQFYARPLYSRGNPLDIHCIGGWLDPTADLDAIEEEEKVFFLCRQSNSDSSRLSRLWPIVGLTGGWKILHNSFIISTPYKIIFE
jgi:hypothetical protein